MNAARYRVCNPLIFDIIKSRLLHSVYNNFNNHIGLTFVIIIIQKYFNLII